MTENQAAAYEPVRNPLFAAVRSITDDPEVRAAVDAAESAKRPPPDSSWVRTAPVRGYRGRHRR